VGRGGGGEGGRGGGAELHVDMFAVTTVALPINREHPHCGGLPGKAFTGRNPTSRVRLCLRHVLHGCLLAQGTLDGEGGSGD
jgi:hypothetical protein